VSLFEEMKEDYVPLGLFNEGFWNFLSKNYLDFQTRRANPRLAFS
jgi:hypothetical protein